MDQQICHTCGFTFDGVDEACPVCGASSPGKVRSVRSVDARPPDVVDATLVVAAWAGVVLTFIASFLPWVGHMDVEVAGIVGAGKRTAFWAVTTGIMLAMATVKGFDQPRIPWWTISALVFSIITFVTYLNWLAVVVSWEPPPDLAVEMDPTPRSGLYVGPIAGFIGMCAMTWRTRRALIRFRAAQTADPVAG